MDIRNRFSEYKNTLLADRRRLALLISGITVLLLAVATFTFFMIFQSSNSRQAGATGDGVGYESSVSTLEGKEMRGVWVASVFNINYPSSANLSVKEMKAELDTIVETAKKANLNSILFQAVPSADALYKSEIYPWSQFLTGNQGKAPGKDFDPLAYIIDKAHSEGLELHAWVNPYRVTTGNVSLDTLDASHPARTNPALCVKYDGKYYYNPGLPEVRTLIADVVGEIVTNYDVDGIHFDDYFYPYPVENATFDDSAAFASYGGGLELADWRRQNVNETIKGVYNRIKSIDPDCAFGVSPFGIYANSGSPSPVKGSETSGLESYFSLYCDPLTWARGGYVDYLAPQVYWSFATTAAPYDTVCKWWNANLDGTGVKLYIGHAAHKVADFGKNEIPTQVEFARTLLTCEGSIFYGYAFLADESTGLISKLSSLYSEPIIYSNITSNGRTAAISYPAPNYKTSAKTQYMLGSSDPAYPLTINGVPLSRTKDGYFSLYANLSEGANSYTVKQGDTTLLHTVTHTTSSSSVTNTLPSFEITDTTPDCETWISGGDTVTFSCTAPAGATVTAKVGGSVVTLKPTLNAKASSGKYIKEVYKGSLKFGTYAPAGQIVDLGTITFTAKSGGKSATKSVGLMKEIGSGAYIYAQVEKDYTHLKKSPSSSFYDDYTPTSAGMRDYIIGFTDGYYKLKFGGYVDSSSVTVVEGQPLYDNMVTSAVMECHTDDTVKNYDGNYTELRFGTLENVPVDVWVSGDEVTIVLYATDPMIKPVPELCENPLFSSVSAKTGASGKTILYTLKLKNAENYYGFNLSYDKSFVSVKFNNPINMYDDMLPLRDKLIFVDAGHGGEDIGARGPGESDIAMFESNLNLLIANELTRKLADLGATVYTTRTEDVTYSLYDRLDMIDAVRPDLLISVHHNSVADSANATKARGFLSLYSNNSGILLAKTVSNTLCDSLNRFERTTAYQKLAVARDHRFPSALAEMSFISNIEEFQWTLSDGNIERSAQALAQGILDFYKKQEQFING